MRRRVGIAQAIVADPELLLLDEPTTGLDPEQRMRFRQLIAGLGEQRTVVLSTHLVEDVAAVCTRVVVTGRARFQLPTELRRLADGQVWNSPEDSPGAVASGGPRAGPIGCWAAALAGRHPAAADRGGRLPAGLRPLPGGRGRMTGALAGSRPAVARSPLLWLGVALAAAGVAPPL